MKNDNPTAYHQSLTRQGKDNDTVLGNGTTAAVTDSSATKKQAGSKPPAEDIPIEKGATLLHLYKVESDPIVGGMGRVFRVRHTGWNTDLAMKQPKKELFRNEAEKQAFIHECDAWINLGLHPHIVSCYYVRETGGIPSIFSEGQTIRPGLTIRPQGQTIRPQGLTIRPQGQTISPQGLTIRPQGLTIRPQGLTIRLQGLTIKPQ
ncbi:MAG: hypothetical protein LBF62_13075 [Tannerellaceae bacterium]|jgi:hypothetical protein|nr:hypothetical protein [Tannerellaceae bacterium]